jgi:hypothetical protein
MGWIRRWGKLGLAASIVNRWEERGERREAGLAGEGLNAGWEGDA